MFLILNYKLRVLNEKCHFKKLYRGCLLFASALTWFIRYIYYWNLQFLNNVFINKAKVLLPKAYVTLDEFGYYVKIIWVLLLPKL